MQPYTIIGAGGAIGTPLAQELIKSGKPVRLLSRSAKPQEGAESLAVDVFNQQALTEAVKGSKVAFLLVGLEYNAKLWAEKWPLVMQNTLKACADTGVPLVFFDNVYMYGPVEGKMTEETPYKPSSKKGKVRAEIANMLHQAVREGKVKALIARSADFYGPWADEKGVFYQTVIKNCCSWLQATKQDENDLFVASKNNDLEKLKSLLKNTLVDVNITDKVSMAIYWYMSQ